MNRECWWELVAVRAADPRAAASKPRACVRTKMARWMAWHGMAKVMLRLLPRLLSPANPAIAGEGPLSPPTPQGAPSRSHPPCRRLAVPVQSCSSPAVCRSRVFTEFLVSSMRCTTVVPPRDDYSMTGTTTVLLLLLLLPAATTRATTTTNGTTVVADASSIYDGRAG